ncbi:MAG TPA: thioredoxin family protein [Nocardioides sp.]|nr:thioredoxin family protein [Nocardioides sp.]
MLIAAVAAVLGLGLWRLATDGRFRGTHEVKGAEGEARGDVDEPATLVEVLPPGTRLGERATLVQFSTAFCAPCRATRRTLTEVADVVSGVEHVEIDAEHHLDLVRRLGVVRTPTTLVLDARGREVSRAAGAPRKEQVLGALASATSP